MEGTPQQPSVPAGWYPDPNGEGQRYWDGSAWTVHTAPAASTEPAGAGSGASEAAAGSAGAGAGAAAAEAAAASTAGAGTGGPESGTQASTPAGQASGPATQTGTQASTPAAPAAAGAPPSADPHAAHAGSAAATGDQPTTATWVLSVLLPLVPIAGLIWGVYLKRQGPAMENPANVAIILSLVIILIGVLTLR